MDQNQKQPDPREELNICELCDHGMTITSMQAKSADLHVLCTYPKSAVIRFTPGRIVVECSRFKSKKLEMGK